MYLTVAELRLAVPALGDSGKFSDDALEAYIVEFAEIAEDYRGVAYEPRTAVESFNAREWGTWLLLRHPYVRSITAFSIGEDAVDLDDVILHKEMSRIRYDTGWSYDDALVITYTHGLGYRQVSDGVTTNASTTVTSATAAFLADDVGKPITGTNIPAGTTIASVTNATTVVLSVAATGAGTGITFTIGSLPAVLLRACREYVRACALQDRGNVPRDVIGQSFEGTYTRYSTPDKAAGRPTGYLEVDRLLNSLEDHRVPVVA